jgi:hypothetical protein
MLSRPRPQFLGKVMLIFPVNNRVSRSSCLVKVRMVMSSKYAIAFSREKRTQYFQEFASVQVCRKWLGRVGL